MLNYLFAILDIDAWTEVTRIDATAVEGVDMRIGHPLSFHFYDP